MIEFTRRHIIKEIKVINIVPKIIKKTIADPQKGKIKLDPRLMQGTALLLLTIAISISMLISGLFTLDKKLIQTLNVC